VSGSSQPQFFKGFLASPSPILLEISEVRPNLQVRRDPATNFFFFLSVGAGCNAGIFLLCHLCKQGHKQAGKRYCRIGKMASTEPPAAIVKSSQYDPSTHGLRSDFVLTNFTKVSDFTGFIFGLQRRVS
jgi:hypothetical protein